MTALNIMEENSFPHFEKIRELVAAGDYKGADEHFVKHISYERLSTQKPLQLPACRAAQARLPEHR